MRELGGDKIKRKMGREGRKREEKKKRGKKTRILRGKRERQNENKEMR